jgi:cobalt-zinc-cadmium efflux system membrane fusion protein
MVMRQVQRRSLTQRLQVPGEVEAPQHAVAEVGAPLAGRLMAPAGGTLPQIGDRVEAGQVLGMLVPPTTLSDATALEANQASRHAIETELQLRLFEVEARALEIREAVHHSELELDFARRSLARVEGLRSKNLGTQQELEDAQLAVELALHDGEGASGLEKAFESVRKQLKLLKAANLERGKSTALDPKLLIAPIAGEIIEASHVAGEHVESDGSVYRIMNLERVWIATHVSEFDFAEVSATSGALLEFAAYPERRFDVLSELNGRVVNVGRVVAPETRTIELRYEADNPDGLLRAGMFVDAYLETKHARNTIAVPESSIVMDNGQPVAFVLWHGEAFRKVVLTLGIRDAGYVEILEGIEEGDRVVTEQAYLVKLASASPAAFGEGHAH